MDSIISRVRCEHDPVDKRLRSMPYTTGRGIAHIVSSVNKPIGIMNVVTCFVHVFSSCCLRNLCTDVGWDVCECENGVEERSTPEMRRGDPYSSRADLGRSS